MGQEFKSGPGITGFNYEAGSGQDLVWSLLIGKITQYHVFTLSWQTGNYWVVSFWTSAVYVWNWSTQKLSEQYWLEESLAFLSLEKWLFTLNCKLGIAVTPQTVSYRARYRRLQTFGSSFGQIPVPSLVGVIAIPVSECFLHLKLRYFGSYWGYLDGL